MTISILSTFARQNDGDFPLLLNTDVGGGWMTVADNAARDAIKSNIRSEGMHVWSVADATLYQLDADLVTWIAVPFGGGGGGGGLGGNADFLHVALSANQTTIAPADPCEFDAIIAQAAGSALTLGVAGRIQNLQAGIAYRLDAGITVGGGTSNYLVYAWYDVTAGAFIGSEGGIRAVPADNATNPATLASAIIVPAVTTEVELRFTAVGTGTVAAIANAFATGVLDCWATITSLGSGAVWIDDGTNITPLNEPRVLRMSSTGNARGAQAIDLQQSRSAITQVASGANSFIVGANNTASAAATAAVGGSSNQATGLRAATLGGFGNVASGDDAVAIGIGVSAAGNYSLALGNASDATWPAEIAHANVEFGSPGDAQIRRAIVRRNDVDSSGAAVVLTLDGTGVPTALNTLVVPDNTMWLIEAHVAFVDNDQDNEGIWDQCGFVLRAVAYNNTASPVNVQIGTVEIDKIAGNVNSAATLVANVVTGSIDVQCTPGKVDVGRIYHYLAHVMITQVANIPPP